MGRIPRPQNLNDVFYSAAQHFRQKPVPLTHQQRVCRLYRHSLRLLLSWAIDRDIFNIEATKIRERFDNNRNVSKAASLRIIEEAEDEMFKFTHPDPYKVPYMPGGTLFMRDSPLPAHICFPDGNVPDDFPKYTINPDYSICTPDSGRNATGTVLVDFYKKNME